MAGLLAKAQLRQTFTLLSGTVGAQLISLLTAPLLARIFDPSAFGNLALYLAALGFIGVLASGRYELAIILPADDQDALTLLCLTLFLALATTVLLVALFSFFGSRALSLPGMDEVKSWHWLLPLAVLPTAALASLSAWANRKARYRLLAGVRLLQAAVIAVISVLAGNAGALDVGLIWGSIAGTWAACGVLAWLLLNSGMGSSLPVSWASLMSAASRHSAFPRLNMPHALLDNLQSLLLLSILGAVWGAAAVGLYAFAMRIVRTPIAMVSSAMGQVFQQHAVAAFNEGRRLRPLLLLQWRQQLVWLIGGTLLVSTSPWAFSWLFGPIWKESGFYALILWPWIALNFVMSPLSQLPLILGRQKGALLWGIAYQSALLLPILLAWLLEAGMKQALFAHSMMASGVLVAYGLWLWKVSALGDEHG